MKKLTALLAAATFTATAVSPASACTGISFIAKDGTRIQARTIEWSGYDLKAKLAVWPRGVKKTSYTPDGKNGLSWTTRYGVVGATTVMDEFITEGINEKGLSAGIFFFSHYGSLAPYNPKKAKQSVSDAELVPWILTNFATVDEVLKHLKKIDVIPIAKPDKNGNYNTGHWRIADASGRSVVLEITNKGERKIYENKVGVLTNSPSFAWHLSNLNNYINLMPGTVPEKTFGGANLFSLGSGSSLLGIPGDFTPPSRFVRAFFWLHGSRTPEDKYGAVTQAFHILNAFDIPIGAEFAPDQPIPNIPSATQVTCVSDTTHPTFYYRTMYNSQIRKVDLTKIDFKKVSYMVTALDEDPKEQIKERMF